MFCRATFVFFFFKDNSQVKANPAAKYRAALSFAVGTGASKSDPLRLHRVRKVTRKLPDLTDRTEMVGSVGKIGSIGYVG